MTCDHVAAADLDQDRKDDLLCFDPEGAAYVTFAGSTSFGPLTTLVSTFHDSEDLPLVGETGDSKGTCTRIAADREIPITDLYRWNTETGELRRHQALVGFPVPSGAPFERYRFFTEKGLGVAMFPEWIFSEACIAPDHELHLLGASGVGVGRITSSSVKPGGAQGHMLEELGHSIFSNCFHAGTDKFGMYQDMFNTPIGDGGFEAMNIGGMCTQQDTDDDLEPLPGIPGWIDCRDPEHYFLGFMKTYRKEGDAIRASIAAETNSSWRTRWQAQYEWLRLHWFQRVEYYRDPRPVAGRRETLGLQCLPGYWCSWSPPRCLRR